MLVKFNPFLLIYFIKNKIPKKLYIFQPLQIMVKNYVPQILKLSSQYII